MAELEGGPRGEADREACSPPSDLALVGVYMFDTNVFEAANAIEPSARGELEITDAIQYLIDKGYRVEAAHVSGWWKDTGKLEDMLEANRLDANTMSGDVTVTLTETTLDGAVVVDEGGVLRALHRRGPLIIGAGSRDSETYVGPTRRSSRRDVENSEMEHSIILEHSADVDLGARMDRRRIGS